MKKIIILLIVAVILILPDTSRAATPTTDSSTSAAEIEKIQKLKDIVASRVAELKLVEKRGILGTVKEVSNNTQLTVEDNERNLRIIDIDELTKFQGLSISKTYGISDVKPGDLITFIGLYNKDTKRLIARYAFARKTLPVQIEGVVLNKDKINYTLTVSDEKGVKKTIDIVTATKTRSHSKVFDLVKSGFSKIDIGQRVILTGFYDLKDNNKIVADRIIFFTDIPLSKTMKSYLEKSQGQASESAKTETPSPSPVKKNIKPI